MSSIENDAQGFLICVLQSIKDPSTEEWLTLARSMFKELAISTDSSISENMVRIVFKDESIADLTIKEWENIRGW